MNTNRNNEYCVCEVENDKGHKCTHGKL